MPSGEHMLMVDADGHVMEPVDLWENYIDPEYRDRAIKLEHDKDGFEVLTFDGKPFEALRGKLAALGGIEMDTERLSTKGGMTYAEGCPPGGYDPAERIKVLDQEGVDISLMYPTIGICWEAHVRDPKLATAYTRAYNRWIVEFCSHDRKRMVPVAHISLLDPEGAVEEVIRARKDGCVGIMLSPDMAARNGLHFDDPVFKPFWETVQDLDMPIAFHVVVRDQPSYHEWLHPKAPTGLFNFAFVAMDVMAAFTMFLSLGMFEMYPGVRLAVLETGANWIAAWLERLDHKYEVTPTKRLKIKPSDYFRRQCLVSADPDETMTAAVMDHIGADYFIWASDYPHIDASMGVIPELRRNVADLPEANQRKIFGENAKKFYRLSV